MIKTIPAEKWAEVVEKLADAGKKLCLLAALMISRLLKL